MTIAIPEDFKDTLWDRKLYLAKKGDNRSFLIHDHDSQERLKVSLKEMILRHKDSNSEAFNRFMLANIFETKSVNNLLELPEGFEEFSDCELTFVAEQYRVSVSKV
jgi:hypothetical protein